MFARLKCDVWILGGKDGQGIPVNGKMGDLALVLRPGDIASNGFYVEGTYEILLHGIIGVVNHDKLAFLRDTEREDD